MYTDAHFDYMLAFGSTQRENRGFSRAKQHLCWQATAQRQVVAGRGFGEAEIQSDDFMGRAERWFLQEM